MNYDQLQTAMKRSDGQHMNIPTHSNAIVNNNIFMNLQYAKIDSTLRPLLSCLNIEQQQLHLQEQKEFPNSNDTNGMYHYNIQKLLELKKEQCKHMTDLKNIFSSYGTLLSSSPQAQVHSQQALAFFLISTSEYFLLPFKLILQRGYKNSSLPQYKSCTNNDNDNQTQLLLLQSSEFKCLLSSAHALRIYYSCFATSSSLVNTENKEKTSQMVISSLLSLAMAIHNILAITRPENMSNNTLGSNRLDYGDEALIELFKCIREILQTFRFPSSGENLLFHAMNGTLVAQIIDLSLSILRAPSKRKASSNKNTKATTTASTEHHINPEKLTSESLETLELLLTISSSSLNKNINTKNPHGKRIENKENQKVWRSVFPGTFSTLYSFVIYQIGFVRRNIITLNQQNNKKSKAFKIKSLHVLNLLLQVALASGDFDKEEKSNTNDELSMVIKQHATKSLLSVVSKANAAHHDRKETTQQQQDSDKMTNHIKPSHRRSNDVKEKEDSPSFVIQVQSRISRPLTILISQLGQSIASSFVEIPCSKEKEDQQRQRESNHIHHQVKLQKEVLLLCRVILKDTLVFFSTTTSSSSEEETNCRVLVQTALETCLVMMQMNTNSSSTSEVQAQCTYNTTNSIHEEARNIVFNYWLNLSSCTHHNYDEKQRQQQIITRIIELFRELYSLTIIIEASDKKEEPSSLSPQQLKLVQENEKDRVKVTTTYHDNSYGHRESQIKHILDILLGYFSFLSSSSFPPKNEQKEEQDGSSSSVFPLLVQLTSCPNTIEIIKKAFISTLRIDTDIITSFPLHDLISCSSSTSESRSTSDYFLHAPQQEMSDISFIHIKQKSTRNTLFSLLHSFGKIVTFDVIALWVDEVISDLYHHLISPSVSFADNVNRNHSTHHQYKNHISRKDNAEKNDFIAKFIMMKHMLVGSLSSLSSNPSSESYHGFISLCRAILPILLNDPIWNLPTTATTFCSTIASNRSILPADEQTADGNFLDDETLLTQLFQSSLSSDPCISLINNNRGRYRSSSSRQRINSIMSSTAQPAKPIVNQKDINTNAHLLSQIIDFIGTLYSQSKTQKTTTVYNFDILPIILYPLLEKAGSSCSSVNGKRMATTIVSSRGNNHTHVQQIAICTLKYHIIPHSSNAHVYHHHHPDTIMSDFLISNADYLMESMISEIKSSCQRISTTIPKLHRREDGDRNHNSYGQVLIQTHQHSFDSSSITHILDVMQAFFIACMNASTSESSLFYPLEDNSHLISNRRLLLDLVNSVNSMFDSVMVAQNSRNVEMSLSMINVLQNALRFIQQIYCIGDYHDLGNIQEKQDESPSWWLNLIKDDVLKRDDNTNTETNTSEWEKHEDPKEGFLGYWKEKDTQLQKLEQEQRLKEQTLEKHTETFDHSDTGLNADGISRVTHTINQTIFRFSYLLSFSANQEDSLNDNRPNGGNEGSLKTQIASCDGLSEGLRTLCFFENSIIRRRRNIRQKHEKQKDDSEHHENIFLPSVNDTWPSIQARLNRTISNILLLTRQQHSLPYTPSSFSLSQQTVFACSLLNVVSTIIHLCGKDSSFMADRFEYGIWPKLHKFMLHYLGMISTRHTTQDGSKNLRAFTTKPKIKTSTTLKREDLILSTPNSNKWSNTKAQTKTNTRSNALHETIPTRRAIYSERSEGVSEHETKLLLAICKCIECVYTQVDCGISLSKKLLPVVGNTLISFLTFYNEYDKTITDSKDLKIGDTIESTLKVLIQIDFTSLLRGLITIGRKSDDLKNPLLSLKKIQSEESSLQPYRVDKQSVVNMRTKNNMYNKFSNRASDLLDLIDGMNEKPIL